MDCPSASPPPPRPESTGRHMTISETTAERALRIALAARADIGYPPDPSASPPDPGSGMRRTLAEIRTDLAEIKALVSAGSRFIRWSAVVFFGALLVLAAGATWHLASRVRIVDAPERGPNALR